VIKEGKRKLFKNLKESDLREEEDLGEGACSHSRTGGKEKSFSKLNLP